MGQVFRRIQREVENRKRQVLVKGSDCILCWRLIILNKYNAMESISSGSPVLLALVHSSSFSIQFNSVISADELFEVICKALV